MIEQTTEYRAEGAEPARWRCHDCGACGGRSYIWMDDGTWRSKNPRPLGKLELAMLDCMKSPEVERHIREHLAYSRSVFGALMGPKEPQRFRLVEHPEAEGFMRIEPVEPEPPGTQGV